MIHLKSIAEDLVRRQRVKASYDEGNVTIEIDGEEIFISEDRENDRIVFWAEVAHGVRDNMRTAAEIAINYNYEFTLDRVLSLGVSEAADCAILGRNMEIESPDAVRILNEASDFRAELAAAKIYFQDALAAFRKEMAGEEAPMPAPDAGHYVRV